MENKVVYILDTNKGSQELKVGYSHVEENGIMVVRLFIDKGEEQWKYIKNFMTMICMTY